MKYCNNEYSAAETLERTWRVVVADDEPPLRSALCLLLEQEPVLDVVGEAADSRTAQEQVAARTPDLLLFDWELPGNERAALLRSLRETAPDLRTIALSSRPEACPAALAAGAHAFVSKGDPPECLLSAIHRLQREAAQAGE